MGSSGICTNSDAVSSRSGFGDGVCLSVLLYLCCQCVHCISLEWNFTFRNAGEKPVSNRHRVHTDKTARQRTLLRLPTSADTP